MESCWHKYIFVPNEDRDSSFYNKLNILLDNISKVENKNVRMKSEMKIIIIQLIYSDFILIVIIVLLYSSAFFRWSSSGNFEINILFYSLNNGFGSKFLDRYQKW